MRVLGWIVEETWQAAAAAFLPADADITLLHVRASDAEAVARCALLGRSRRLPAEPLEAMCEQGARELLADAQAVLGRAAVLDARSGRIEQEVVAAAGTADLLVLARDEDRAHRGPRSLGPLRATASTTRRVPCCSSGPTRPPDEQSRHVTTPASPTTEGGREWTSS